MNETINRIYLTFFVNLLLLELRSRPFWTHAGPQLHIPLAVLKHVTLSLPCRLLPRFSTTTTTSLHHLVLITSFVLLLAARNHFPTDDLFQPKPLLSRFRVALARLDHRDRLFPPPRMYLLLCTSVFSFFFSCLPERSFLFSSFIPPFLQQPWPPAADTQSRQHTSPHQGHAIGTRVCLCVCVCLE